MLFVLKPTAAYRGIWKEVTHEAVTAEAQAAWRTTASVTRWSDMRSLTHTQSFCVNKREMHFMITITGTHPVTYNHRTFPIRENCCWFSWRRSPCACVVVLGMSPPSLCYWSVSPSVCAPDFSCVLLPHDQCEFLPLVSVSVFPVVL